MNCCLDYINSACTCTCTMYVHVYIVYMQLCIYMYMYMYMYGHNSQKIQMITHKITVILKVTANGASEDWCITAKHV